MEQEEGDAGPKTLANPRAHREFTDADGPQTTNVAVVNDAMARRAFPDSDPIGRRVRIGYARRDAPTEPWLTIVGVVSNTRSQRCNRVDWDQEPMVYRAFTQRRDSSAATRRFDAQPLYIFVRGRSIAVGPIGSAIHAIDSDLPVAPLRTGGDIVSELRAQPRRSAGSRC